jgi:hypothetical protein
MLLNNIFNRTLGSARLFFGLLIVLFIWAYWPAYQLQFRVEQWAIYDYYQSLPYPASIEEWGHIAFWTPLGDYRFIPLAYLWNYLEFKLFDLNFAWYTTLSLGLYALNAALLGWLAYLYNKGQTAAFWLTTVFALFLPSAMEIAIWTFFSYKLFQLTLMTMALIMLEKGITQRSSIYVLFSIVICFISTLFYEALALFLGYWILRISYSKLSTRTALNFICLLLMVLYLSSTWFFAQFPNLFGVSPIAIPEANPMRVLESLYQWIKYGWLLDNLGFGVEFRENARFITMHLLSPRKIHLLFVLLLWFSLLCSIRWTAVSWRQIGLFSILLGLSTILILGGRTATNGPDYLSHFSMYNYNAITFISPILGTIFSSTWANSNSSNLRTKIALLSLSLLTILWINTIRNGIETYIRSESIHISLMRLSNEIINSTNLPIVVVASKGPFEIPGLNLLFHALHLVHGEIISNEVEKLPSIYIDDDAIKLLRNNPQISSEDFKRLTLRAQ